MARVTFENDELNVTMSLLDQLLSFHGSFRIPLSHVSSANAISIPDLELQWRLLGTGVGSLKTAGIFTTPNGILFCDISGHGNCLVIETHGERFKRLAFTLDDGQDPNEIAQKICSKCAPNA